MRVTTSAGPPGGNGTIERIGLDGHPVCACASVPANVVATTKTAVRCLAFMPPSPRRRRRRRRRRWRRVARGRGGKATRHGNLVALCIHALDEGAFEAPLESERGSFSG